MNRLVHKIIQFTKRKKGNVQKTKFTKCNSIHKMTQFLKCKNNTEKIKLTKFQKGNERHKIIKYFTKPRHNE